MVRADVAWLHQRLTRPVGGGGAGGDGATCMMERAGPKAGSSFMYLWALAPTRGYTTRGRLLRLVGARPWRGLRGAAALGTQRRPRSPGVCRPPVLEAAALRQGGSHPEASSSRRRSIRGRSLPSAFAPAGVPPVGARSRGCSSRGLSHPRAFLSRAFARVGALMKPSL